jgi:hypothetical protein
MRRFLFAAIVSVLGCRTSDRGAATTADSPRAGSGSDEWLLAPGAGTGAVSDSSSDAELRERFGEAQVDTTRIELGEGETAPGTVLFPNDSLRRMEIIWQDTATRSLPSRIILRGERSRWHVGPGISLNTSLADLERLNGQPFTLAGFGWDYAGVITSWNGGALDSSLAQVKLYLDPGPMQYGSEPYQKVLGDQDYASDLPEMKQLSPKVRTIYIDFPHQ